MSSVPDPEILPQLLVYVAVAVTATAQYPIWLKVALRVAAGEDALGWLTLTEYETGGATKFFPSAEYCTFPYDQDQVGPLTVQFAVEFGAFATVALSEPLA